MRIFPSDCIATLKTEMSALGLKEVSSVPSAFSLAIALRLTPPIEAKPPPMRIFPSDCIATLLTELSALGLKEVSSVPSAFSLAIRLRRTPPTEVKSPTMIIFPSDCNTTLRTALLAPAPGSKVVSSSPPSEARLKKGCPRVIRQIHIITSSRKAAVDADSAIGLCPAAPLLFKS